MAFTAKQIQQAMRVAAMMMGGAPVAGGAGKVAGQAIRKAGQGAGIPTLLQSKGGAQNAKRSTLLQSKGGAQNARMQRERIIGGMVPMPQIRGAAGSMVTMPQKRGATGGMVPMSMQTPPPRPDVLMKRKMVESAAKRKMTGGY